MGNETIAYSCDQGFSCVFAEYNLLRADEEYRNGNVEHSIYYQVRAQFQSTDLRYITEAEELEKQRPTTEQLLKVASKQEKRDFKGYFTR